MAEKVYLGDGLPRGVRRLRARAHDLERHRGDEPHRARARGVLGARRLRRASEVDTERRRAVNQYLNVSISNVSFRKPEWNGPSWFNLGVGGFSIAVLIPKRFYRSFPVWPYNAFRRVYDNPAHNCWGFGLLQVGGRHLLSVVSNEEKFQIDVAFLHVVLVDKTREGE